jgi:predicted nucleotidyltransferase
LQRPGHHILKRATPSEIKRLCEKIAREFRPEKIILFGSHAYGKPEWDSDVDLLIIMPFKGRPHRQANNIRSRIEAPMSLDLLVRTPEEIKKRLEMEDFFIREIIERGKLMYEANHEGVDSQGGR